MYAFIKNILGFSHQNTVRILMYHMVLPEKESFKNDMIVTQENLDRQLAYIKEKYHCVFFRELENSKDIPQKIILTFDDGYLNNKKYLLPVLKKYGLKATIFIPTQLIAEQEIRADRSLMTFEEIRNLDEEYIEIALHSHQHKNYSEMSLAEAQQDIQANISRLTQEKIRFTKVLAYPYGKFPTKKKAQKAFFTILKDHGIWAALRIGNDIAHFPFSNPFTVKRIDIKYADSFRTFRWKLRLGKVKL